MHIAVLKEQNLVSSEEHWFYLHLNTDRLVLGFATFHGHGGLTLLQFLELLHLHFALKTERKGIGKDKSIFTVVSTQKGMEKDRVLALFRTTSRSWTAWSSPFSRTFSWLSSKWTTARVHVSMWQFKQEPRIRRYNFWEGNRKNVILVDILAHTHCHSALCWIGCWILSILAQFSGISYLE